MFRDISTIPSSTRTTISSRLPFIIPAAIAVIFGSFLLLGPLVQHANVTDFDKAAFANRTFHVVGFVGIGIIINCIAFKIWNKDSSNLNKAQPLETYQFLNEDEFEEFNKQNGDF